MGTRAWSKKGINYRRQGALERLKASKFTPKTIQGKERSEKNWTAKKEHKVKFQYKKLLDQQKEVDEQWKRIQKLQSLDTDL